MTMINSLFSSFDPIRSLIRINYIIILVVFITPIMLKLNPLNNRITSVFLSTLTYLESEIKASIINNNNLGKIKILLAVFFIVLTFNLIGLVPYIFTITAQLLFTLRLSIPFWLAFVLFSLSKNTQHFLAHLVPTGTPIALSQFMVLIESVRQIIRPITLSVRLAANITAGHILIALARAPILIINHMTLALRILFLLELAVAFIQSYVFVVLLSIYLRETK